MSHDSKLPTANRRWLEPRRLQFVGQLEAADCAAACLAMVFSAYGADVSLQSLRLELQVSTSGASVRSIVDVASRRGRQARLMRCELEDLVHLQPASILHWDFNHFVVLEKIRGNRVTILDPALGRHQVALAQLGESFTGVAIEFRADSLPLAADEAAPNSSPSIWKLLRKGPDLGRVLFLSLSLQLLALALPLFTGVVVDRVLPRYAYASQDGRYVQTLAASVRGPTDSYARVSVSPGLSVSAPLVGGEGLSALAHLSVTFGRKSAIGVW